MFLLKVDTKSKFNFFLHFQNIVLQMTDHFLSNVWSVMFIQLHLYVSFDDCFKLTWVKYTSLSVNDISMYGLLSDCDCPRFIHFRLKTMYKMTQITSTKAPVTPRTIMFTPITKKQWKCKHENWLESQYFVHSHC